jgi:hypothetical protein
LGKPIAGSSPLRTRNQGVTRTSITMPTASSLLFAQAAHEVQGRPGGIAPISSHNRNHRTVSRYRPWSKRRPCPRP